MGRRPPTPTPLTQPFWDAVRDGRLVVPECDSCKARFFVPEPVCPACGSGCWHWAESPGTGTVYTLSVVHHAPGPEFDVPYVLAVVDLDDGWALLTHVLGCDPADAHIGMRVRLAPTRLTDDITLPTFTALP